MADTPQDPIQRIAPFTVEQQLQQRALSTQFDFRTMLRNLRAQVLLFTTYDGPIEPTLGGMILQELEGISTAIKSAMSPQQGPPPPNE